MIDDWKLQQVNLTDELNLKPEAVFIPEKEALVSFTAKILNCQARVTEDRRLLEIKKE